MLLANFRNPFILVLVLLGFVSYLTDDMKAVVVVSVMIAVSVLMRFLQEFRSSKAAEKLRAMVRTTATVLRRSDKEDPDGAGQSVRERREIPFEELVPGDIIYLSAGDMTPADDSSGKRAPRSMREKAHTQNEPSGRGQHDG
jgi:Mg2+-importing ATPase